MKNVMVRMSAEMHREIADQSVEFDIPMNTIMSAAIAGYVFERTSLLKQKQIDDAACKAAGVRNSRVYDYASNQRGGISDSMVFTPMGREELAKAYYEK